MDKKVISMGIFWLFIFLTNAMDKSNLYGKKIVFDIDYDEFLQGKQEEEFLASCTEYLKGSNYHLTCKGQGKGIEKTEANQLILNLEGSSSDILNIPNPFVIEAAGFPKIQEKTTNSILYTKNVLQLNDKENVPAVPARLNKFLRSKKDDETLKVKKVSQIKLEFDKDYRTFFGDDMADREQIMKKFVESCNYSLELEYKIKCIKVGYNHNNMLLELTFEGRVEVIQQVFYDAAKPFIIEVGGFDTLQFLPEMYQKMKDSVEEDKNLEKEHKLILEFDQNDYDLFFEIDAENSDPRKLLLKQKSFLKQCNEYLKKKNLSTTLSCLNITPGGNAETNTVLLTLKGNEKEILEIINGSKKFKIKTNEFYPLVFYPDIAIKQNILLKEYGPEPPKNNSDNN